MSGRFPGKNKDDIGSMSLEQLRRYRTKLERTIIPGLKREMGDGDGNQPSTYFHAAGRWQSARAELKNVEKQIYELE